jgi:hypothetical protein
MQNTNLFWTLIGVVGGGVLSLVITLVVQRFSNRKLIYYEITTIRYYSSDKNDTFFSFKGALVDSMHISVVKISTRSNGIIRIKDFVPDQPLVLTDIDAPGKIYTIKNGSFVNNYSRYFDRHKTYSNAQLAITQVSKDKAILEFDYIEKKRPLEFLVFHDAKLRVEGKLIDGVIKEKIPLINKVRKWSFSDICLVVATILSIALTVLVSIWIK